MSEPFTLVLEATVKPGKLPDFTSTMARLAADVKAQEPGVLDYRTFVDEGSQRIVGVDSYASSEAFLSHMGRQIVAETFPRVMAMLEVRRLLILGNVSPQVKAALEPMGAAFTPPHGGFNRLEPASVRHG